jgi:hypothetical protein
MSTSYYAGLALGIELTEDMLLGPHIRTVNKGCVHTIPGEHKFCPECGKQVEMLPVHKVKPPFDQDGDKEHTGPASWFWANREDSYFCDLKIIGVTQDSWRNEEPKFILGEELSNCDLTYAIKKYDTHDPTKICDRAKEMLSKFATMGLSGEVKLWSYGWSC